MLDIHSPEHTPHTRHDFFVHLGIVVLGILIAIGLEQTVEAIHRSHQRHELLADLRGEAANNRQIIARDLLMQALEPWFDQAIHAIDSATPQHGKIRITLPFAPCIPGSVGTSSERYFAPSEAVWTTAKESSLVGLLPVEQARMYARLAHNYDLLGVNRDEVYHGCTAIASMQHRAARLSADGAAAIWTLSPAQAEHLAQLSGDTRTAIKALCFRLRWSDVYEQGILAGQTKADQHMMAINQERFEDNQDAIQ